MGVGQVKTEKSTLFFLELVGEGTRWSIKHKHSPWMGFTNKTELLVEGKCPGERKSLKKTQNEND